MGRRTGKQVRRWTWLDECAGCGRFTVCSYEAPSGAYSLCHACEDELWELGYAA